MLYVLLISCVFALILLGINSKNKVVLFFFIMLLGINVFIFSSFLYLIKLTYFFPVFSLDNHLYMVLNHLKLSFYDIVRLINLGIVICLAAQCLFTTFFDPKPKLLVRDLLVTALRFLPVVLFALVNMPGSYKSLYLSYNSAETEAGKYAAMLWFYLITAINQLIFAGCMLSPFWTLIKYYRHTHIKNKKHHATVLALVIATMDVFLICFIALAPLNTFIPSMDTLLMFGGGANSSQNFTFAYLSVALLLALNGILFLLWRYRIIEQVDFMQKRTIRKNMRPLAADMRSVLHSCKNTFLTIEILTMKINGHFGSDQSKNEVAEIGTLSRNALNSVGHLLDIFNDIKINPSFVNLSSCITKALEETGIPPDIQVDNRIIEPEIQIYADAVHIIKMFCNLFYNSIEAIHAAHVERGVITIMMELEDNWISLDIRDNGCGIEKKHLKKVFTPLYSTKQNHTNWGIGLSYVKNVVSAHLGSIYVESVVNEYTDFNILLPVAKERAIS